MSIANSGYENFFFFSLLLLILSFGPCAFIFYCSFFFTLRDFQRTRRDGARLLIEFLITCSLSLGPADVAFHYMTVTHARETIVDDNITDTVDVPSDNNRRRYYSRECR